MVWLLVRVRVMNQNAYPAACEDVLAALSARADRDNINGNHNPLLNPSTLGWLWPASQAVQASRCALLRK